MNVLFYPSLFFFSGLRFIRGSWVCFMVVFCGDFILLMSYVNTHFAYLEQLSLSVWFADNHC